MGVKGYRERYGLVGSVHPDNDLNIFKPDEVETERKSQIFDIMMKIVDEFTLKHGKPTVVYMGMRDHETFRNTLTEMYDAEKADTEATTKQVPVRPRVIGKFDYMGVTYKQGCSSEDGTVIVVHWDNEEDPEPGDEDDE